ncbi:MAG: hypothetical protein EOO61_22730, partial [Hymenobacter sp.]
SYKQKGRLAETAYLAVIGIISPFSVGLQTWSLNTVSYSLSYVLINVLQLPVVILFYRVYLPQTIGKARYGLFAILVPVYLVLYGLNERLGIGAVLEMPFIPQGYRAGISGAQPWDFTRGYFNTDVGYTILILLAATSLYVIKLLFKNQHELFRLETEKLRLELGQLKAQVQPHFFFNTLNNLYSLSVQRSQKAPAMIQDLSGIMRYVLYDTAQERVPLSQEIRFIRSYISLENLRHDETNLIEFSVQGSTDSVMIEPLLFLPLVENTFKHALHRDLCEKWVKLILTVDDKELIFQTSNPKSMQPVSGDRLASGIGLANVKKRMELLYPRRHELVIHDEDGIYT